MRALLVVLLLAACGDDSATLDLSIDASVPHDAAVCAPLSAADGGQPTSCPSCSPLAGACTTPISCGACTGTEMCRYGDGTVCSCISGTRHCGAAQSR